MAYGNLSNRDIADELTKADGLKILPFNPNNLKNASYDISPTMVAMSTKKGMLETVFCEKRYPEKYFIFVRSKDTVLVVSKEYISVPANVAGYVVSRVSKVSEGFGHVSTSIDPNWRGALLIALSNPTNKPIKVYVGGNDTCKPNDPLATITFHYLNTPCDNAKTVYTGMRMDLLEKIRYSRRRGLKAWGNRVLHPYRRNFTDFFFNYCRNQILDESNWERISKDLQGVAEKPECIYCKKYMEADKKKKRRLADYIIKEHFIVRTLHGFEKHWPTILNIIGIIFALLVAFRILPDSWKKTIKEFVEAVHDIR